jgi:hypothetical protein
MYGYINANKVGVLAKSCALITFNRFNGGVSAQLPENGFFRNAIGLPRVVKSRFNEPNVGSAQSHADKRGNAYDFSPQSRDILGRKRLFLLLAFACGFL